MISLFLGIYFKTVYPGRQSYTFSKCSFLLLMHNFGVLRNKLCVRYLHIGTGWGLKHQKSYVAKELNSTYKCKWFLFWLCGAYYNALLFVSNRPKGTSMSLKRLNFVLPMFRWVALVWNSQPFFSQASTFVPTSAWCALPIFR